MKIKGPITKWDDILAARDEPKNDRSATALKLRFVYDRQARSVVEQLAEQLANYIVSGVLLPGAQLPAMERWAKAVHVSVGTAQQVYSLLASHEIVRSALRSGTRILPTAETAARRLLVYFAALQACRYARTLQVPYDEVGSILQAAADASALEVQPQQ